MDPHGEVLFERPMWTWQRSTQSFVPYSPFVVEGAFLNDSVNNGWQPRGHAFTGDRGSNWTAFKCEFKTTPDITFSYVTGDRRHGYRGPLVVAGDAPAPAGDGVNGYQPLITAEDFLNLDFGMSNELQLLAFGSTAISRVLPTSPIVDMPVALAELFREGVPNAIGERLLKDRRVTPTQLSDEYLNYQFGIAPFRADLEAFWQATQRANQLIAERAKNSGKLIRRRYDFDPVLSTTRTISEDPGPGGNRHWFTPCYGADWFPDFGGSQGVREVTTSLKRETWFSGAFTYFFPGEGSDFWSKLRREHAEMQAVYGSLGLETAWNLIPFSWAADWITNVGDVLKNVDAFARDGLVMPYGYVMERCELHIDRTVRGAHLPANVVPEYSTDVPSEVRTSIRITSMRRRKATPYAFGLDESEFTNRQWAILSALGVSLFD